MAAKYSEKLSKILLFCFFCSLFPTYLLLVDSHSVAATYDDVRSDVGRLQSPIPSEAVDAAYSLCGRGDVAQIAILDLLKKLKDEDTKVRAASAHALGCITSISRPEKLMDKIVSELVFALDDTQTTVVYSSTIALGKIGKPCKEIASKKLKALLKDTERDIRFGSGYALSQILGEEAIEAVNVLLEALKNHPDKEVRSDAALGLSKIKAGEESIIATLTQSLKYIEPKVRVSAASALGEISLSAGDRLPQVIDSLSESAKLDANTEVKSESVNSLIKIANVLRNNRKKLKQEILIKVTQALGKAQESLKIENEKLSINLKDPIDELNDQQKSRSQEEISTFITKYSLIIIISGSIILYIFIYVITYITCPRFILRFPSNLKIPKTEFSIPMGFLKYNSRVLDDWTKSHILAVRKKFEQKPTVVERLIHIPLPIKLNNKDDVVFNSSNLREIISDKRWFLLIYGESGSGKTSLACQLAKLAMAEETQTRLCQHRLF